MASLREIPPEPTHATTSSDKKDILFTSTRCKWCAEALSIVRRIGEDAFLLVDVDHPGMTTPPFLDRVPMLLTSTSKVYVDDELFKLLRSRVPVDPFMINEMHGLSDAYSYLGKDGEAEEGIRHAYNFLGGVEEPLVNPHDDSHDRIVNYDTFIQERDNDLNRILNNA